jgi:cbb3-type cytochrome oxidase subunit 3
MIFQITSFFDWVAQSAGVMVFISAFIALTWLGYERKRRGSFTRKKASEEGDDKKFALSKFLKVLSYLGIVVGILDVWAGAMGLILDIPPSFRYAAITENGADHFTCIFLIVIGIAMLFKPVNDMPLASIMGLLAGSAAALALVLFVPDSAVKWIAYWINPKLGLIIVFIIVTAIVAVTAKFYIGILQTISKFLSWPPIAFIIMVFSFVQGILLWGLGMSIFVNFF